MGESPAPYGRPVTPHSSSAEKEPSDSGDSVDHPGWQFDSQLPEEEQVERLVFDRSGFVRMLSTDERFSALPAAAKLKHLDWLERKAREKGHPVDAEYLAGLRTLIRKNAL